MDLTYDDPISLLESGSDTEDLSSLLESESDSDESPFLSPFLKKSDYSNDLEKPHKPTIGGDISSMSTPVKNIVEKVLKKNKKNVECAPGVGVTNSGICSSSSAIAKIRQIFDIKYTDDEKIIEEAKNKTRCKTESCLYTKTNIQKILPDELKTRFNEKGPWNNTKWLDNLNIDDTINKWMTAKFPKHKHLEFSMIDFKKQRNHLASIKWGETCKKYDSLSCVLNTDKTGQPGQHWISIFCDLQSPTKTVEYFDSAGANPPKEITDFLIESVDKIEESKAGPVQSYNITNMEHQMKNTECGVYSIFFILCRKHGVPRSFFEKTRVPDSDMEKFREILFLHS